MLFLGNVNSKYWFRVAGVGVVVTIVAFCVMINKAENEKTIEKMKNINYRRSRRNVPKRYLDTTYN